MNFKMTLRFGTGIFFWVFFLLNFIFKHHNLSTRDICIDEPFSIFYAQLNIADLIAYLSQGNNPPLWEIVLHYWIKIFGIDPYYVRYLPLLFSCITAGLLFKTADKFAGFGAGILTAGLFILSGWNYFFSLEARVYAMFCMLSVFSMYSFFSLHLESDELKYLLQLVVANTLLIYSHYFGFFILLVQFLLVLTQFRNKIFFRHILLSFGVTGLFFLPNLYVFWQRFTSSALQGTWVGPPDQPQRIYLTLYQFLNHNNVFYLLAGFMALGVLFLLIRKFRFSISADFSMSFFSWGVLAWFAIPYVFMFYASYKVPMFLDRYIIYTSLPFFMLLANFLRLVYQSLGRLWLYSIILYVLVVQKHYFSFNDPYFYYREINNSAAQVKKLKDSQSLVLVHPHWAEPAFLYYFDREIFSKPYQKDSLLEAQNIYPVWDTPEAIKVLNEHPKLNVIYYCDEAVKPDSTQDGIVKYLMQNYETGSWTFYPQCTNVMQAKIKPGL